MRLLPLVLIGILPATAHANDGWGGIAATGLTFGQTDDIVMLDEDLYIGPDDIRVAYIFQNTSAKDVTGEVIFPLPPSTWQPRTIPNGTCLMIATPPIW